MGWWSWARKPALGVFVVAVLAAAPARAEELESDGMFEFAPLTAEAGVQASHGICPCFRWSVQVQAASGEIETRHFVISSDALFQVAERYSLIEGDLASRLYTIGAIEALWKGGHVGLGFSGVTVGTDQDLSMSDILRTGFYVLVNLVRTDAIRLDIRSGYEFEQRRLNSGPIEIRHDIPTSLVLDWSSGNWSGDVSATVAFDAADPAWDRLQVTGGASAQYQFLELGDLEAALGFGVFGHWDPSYDEHHLAEWGVSGTLFMSLAWDIDGNSERGR